MSAGIRRGALLASILAALAGLSACSASDADDPIRATRSDLERMRAAIGAHHEQVGALPRDAMALGAVVRAYAPSVPQRGGRPVDAWGRAYRYAPPAEATEPGGSPSGAPPYTLYSLGPDGADDAGRGDDLGRRAGEAPGLGAGARRALQLFPLLVLFAIAPLAWAALRWAKRLAS